MYRNSEIDLENLQDFLQNVVEKVKNQEDPDLLNKVKKVYKKTVPFSMRLYVASYLAKEAQKTYRGRYRSGKKDFYDSKSKSRTDRSTYKDRKPLSENSFEERQPRVRVQIDPSVGATIFISIGRNRHVYPRDLVGMLISAAGLERDRIGEIKVLANYSFVQLFKEDAEKAISVLNGYDYRGSKLVVSYSKMKDEDLENHPEEMLDEQSAEDAAAYAAAEKAAENEPFATPHLNSLGEQ
ncbi:MAG: DbpA RNA binding domain-containing protein [Spirochaetia bacterium]|nr:DbpA RNA binding domain-containing protein [Spirochaetia bacterium]